MHDVKSNIKLVEHIAAASQSVGAVNGTAVDLKGFTNASFLITCGTVGSSGTVVAKIQHSDDGTTWTDSAQVDTGDATVSLPSKTAVFSDRLHVVKPTHRYYRVVLTIGTAASVVGVGVALGGGRHRPVKYP
jgi:hypothetical protein